MLACFCPKVLEKGEEDLVCWHLCVSNNLGYVSVLSGGIEKLTMMDTSFDMVKLCKQAEQNSPNKNVDTTFIVADEEFLPMKEKYA